MRPFLQTKMGKINVLSNYRIKRFCQLLDTHQYRLLCNKKLLSLPIIGYSNFILFQFLVFCPPLMIFDIQSGGILEFFFFFLRAGEGAGTIIYFVLDKIKYYHILKMLQKWIIMERVINFIYVHLSPFILEQQFIIALN